MTQTESAILAHARRCAPAESCGFVVSTPEGERYFPCVNISGEPEAYFRMSPEDWLSAEMQGEIVALVHSHPGGLPWLSEADRRLQVQSDLPWWLVCRGTIHKFRCVPHLTGRRFEHGVTDCYTLFRDAYHLAGIEMPDFYREDDWWRNGQNLYLDNLEAGGLPWLSEADRRLQVQSDLPWWLVCRGAIHKFRCVPHLTGRRFEHGVTDCYTLFRDAYHLAGIEMPDFHRGDDWWRNGQNLYLDNMEATGLYQVPLSAAQPGDVLLCCFGSSVPNHAAIYCGDGELLHHIPEQLSKRERYTDKWQRRTHSLWRHRAWRASAFTGIYNDLVAASTFV
ncbi:hypothetical protein GKE69_26685 [Escherichia coli]|nr:hypothetical protein [Escherichia coli]